MSDRPAAPTSNFLDALDRLHERFLVGVPDVTEIWLIRHGDAYAELVSLDDSRIDPPVSAQGRSEAARLGERLSRSRIDSIWCSELERARETAAIAGGAAGLVPRFDHRVREVRTHWDGAAAGPAEGDESAPAAKYIPFVEPFDEVITRMSSAIKDIATDVGPGGRAAVVSHAGAISVYLSHLLNLEFGQLRMLVQFTSVSVVAMKDDFAVVQSIGDIGHLLREAAVAEEARQ
jgi:probable phosphoglycerate mutase